MNPYPWYNPYYDRRDISPPRHPNEFPRPGYYPDDYRSVSPLEDPERPEMFASFHGGYGTGGWMPGGEWYDDDDEEMPRGRRWSRGPDMPWWMFEDGRFR